MTETRTNTKQTNVLHFTKTGSVVKLKSFISEPPTQEELNLWEKNKNINPRTNKEISKCGYVYKILENAKKNCKVTEEPEKKSSSWFNICGLDALSYNIKDDQNKQIDKSTIYKQLEYDSRTKEYVKMRKKRIDPLTLEKVGNNAFEYYFRWNPFNGEQIDFDSNGPLCFDPDNLIHYFYINRTKFLWKDQERDDQGVTFQGHYDDGVGAGELFDIVSRGEHPEWYLFRLPIIDCYLPKDGNLQVVTFGPKLTKTEISEIYQLALKNKNNYQKKFKKKRPDLIKIFKIYHDAISKDPPITFRGVDIKKLTDNELKTAKYKANCCAVNLLVRL